MKCPFPGMDPYIERPAIWGGLHDALITYIRGELQPPAAPPSTRLAEGSAICHGIPKAHLPRYFRRWRQPRLGTFNGGTACPGDWKSRSYSRRWKKRSASHTGNDRASAWQSPHHAIEILSPTNKIAGVGKEEYLQKRAEGPKGRREHGGDRSAGRSQSDLGVVFRGSAGDSGMALPCRCLAATQTPVRLFRLRCQKPLPKIRVPLANTTRRSSSTCKRHCTGLGRGRIQHSRDTTPPRPAT